MERIVNWAGILFLPYATLVSLIGGGIFNRWSPVYGRNVWLGLCMGYLIALWLLKRGVDSRNRDISTCEKEKLK